MEMLTKIFWWTAWFCAVCVVLGFINPSILLWWEDTQNRMQILKVYGTGWALFLLLHSIMTWL